jgi:hypothetical protein
MFLSSIIGILKTVRLNLIYAFITLDKKLILLQKW